MDESLPAGHGIPAEEIPQYLAEQKANSVKHLLKDEVLITADTLVFLGDEILGKPTDRTDAFAMLKKLNNATHTVITGVCLMTQNQTILFKDKTEVQFAELSDDEINHYIDTYKPYDKAGAYGAQDWIGLVGIQSLKGSYFNVMGLPVHLLYQKLKDIK